MQDGSTLPARELANKTASTSNGSTRAPTAPAKDSTKVLPVSITAAVFQALRGKCACGPMSVQLVGSTPLARVAHFAKVYQTGVHSS